MKSHPENSKIAVLFFAARPIYDILGAILKAIGEPCQTTMVSLAYLCIFAKIVDSIMTGARR